VRRGRSQALLEIGLLALSCGGLTWVAHRIHPTWDDGWLSLQLLRGADSVAASMADRPLLGWIWARLAAGRLLLPASVVLHVATWLGLAIVSRVIWRRLFPSVAWFGSIVGLLAVSTVSLQVQFVLVNPVWGAALGTLMLYLALLCVWPGGAHDQEGVSHRSSRWRAAAGSALVIGAVLLSEYGLVAAATVGSLLGVLGLLATEGGEQRRRAGRAAALVAGSALVAYALFAALADLSARPNVSPERLLDLGSRRLLAVPFVWLTEIWEVGLGNLLRRAGSLQAQSLETLAIAVSSLVATGAVCLLARRGRVSDGAAGADAQAADRGAPARDSPAGSGHSTALLVALGVGLLAMVVLGRVPRFGVTSRYYLPVAPVAACLTGWWTLRLVRRRLQLPAAGALTFVVVFATAQDALSLVRERDRVRVLAATVAPHLEGAPGFSLVVLLENGDHWVRGEATSYELTARFVAAPEIGPRSDFWVIRYQDRRRDGVVGVELLGASADPELHLSLRGLSADYAMKRVIWVEPGRAGDVPLRVDRYP
jgi:hypothetical protein